MSTPTPSRRATVPYPSTAVVPVKRLAEAKSRLSGVLDGRARRRLVLAMLDDVLTALASSPAVARTIVVTPDADVAAAARAQGADVLLETVPADLNQAIQLGCRRAAAEGAARCLVIPGDIPLVTPAEVSQVLDDGNLLPGTVIVPSHDGIGTNALVLYAQDVMEPRFGSDSFAGHLALARSFDLDPRVIRLPGLGFDVDTPQDLSRLCQVEKYAWLRTARLTSAS